MNEVKGRGRGDRKEMSVSINGVTLDLIPPTTDPDAKYSFAVKRSAIDDANRRMKDWRFVAVSHVDGVPIYELREREALKR